MKDPSRSTRQRARQRLDCVAMLIDRSQFEEWRARDMVRNINVYSDGSPVIGEELQGMLIDVHLRTGAMVRKTLPGSQLSYGFAGVTAKGLALLWGMMLLVGASEHSLTWIMDKITSYTTDFGNEIRLLELPSLTKALLAWVAGATLLDVGPMIVQTSRQCPNALRVVGWNHTLGGIMKAVCEQCPGWPQIISDLRAMTNFLRNRSYRKHLMRLLESVVDVKPLKWFTAQFAKWRFETLADACYQLNRLKEIFRHIRKEHFQNVQDKEQLKHFMRAIKDHGGRVILNPQYLTGISPPWDKLYVHFDPCRGSPLASPTSDFPPPLSFPGPFDPMGSVRYGRRPGLNFCFRMIKGAGRRAKWEKWVGSVALLPTRTRILSGGLQ